MSLMNKLKRIVERTEPCGTPSSIGYSLDMQVGDKRTRKRLLCKKSERMRSKRPERLKWFNNL